MMSVFIKENKIVKILQENRYLLIYSEINKTVVSNFERMMNSQTIFCVEMGTCEVASGGLV